MFDSSPIGIGVCDADLRIVVVNKAWAAMDGLAPEDHNGKTVLEVLNVVGCPVEAAMNQVLATGEPIFGLEVTAKVPTRSEVGRWLVNLIPLKDGAGKTTHVGSITVETKPRVGFESFLVARASGIGHPSKPRVEAGRGALEHLSPREIQVTGLLADGKSNKEVASALRISVKTVETHRNRIMKNLDIHSVTQLVRFAIKHSLVS
jgi:PAS domain S-box-containing protein